MHRGYIKLWRKLGESPIKKKPACVALWVDLLIKANHKPNTIIWNNAELHIAQGQALTGRLRLSIDTGLSEMQVRTSLEVLKSTNMITIKAYSKFSIITINNWCDYQDDNQQSNQQVTNKQPTSNQQVTTLKNDKNDKNDKNEEELNTLGAKPQNINSRFIPPTLEEVTDYCISRTNTIDPETFLAFYDSRGWMIGKNKIKNWKACIVTWEKREEKNKGVRF